MCGFQKMMNFDHKNFTDLYLFSSKLSNIKDFWYAFAVQNNQHCDLNLYVQMWAKIAKLGNSILVVG